MMSNNSFASLKNNVKLLVDVEPQCARSYTLLVIRYWQKMEGANNFVDALGCTSPESITRAFRDLVNQGLIVLPEDVAQQRRMREDVYRTRYGGKQLPGFIDLSGNDI